MTTPVRPNFDDQNPTDRDPLAEARAAIPDETPGPGSGVLGTPGLPDTAVPTPPLTPEEAATTSRALFEPTIRRMAILVNTLVALTENGDFALWATLGCFDQVLRGLNWQSVPPRQAERFYTLLQTTLTNYAMRLDEYVVAIHALPAGTPIPPLPDWTKDDTLQMYDVVDTMFPDPVA